MSRCSASAKLFLFVLLALSVPVSTALAWGLGGFRNSAVGGISIDADGVLAQPVADAQARLLESLRERLKRPSAEMNLPVEIRMISLRGLEDAVAQARDSGELPDEVRYLGGLQRIQYVFVYPESNDVVLAGPAEGWRLDDRANVVGVTTGRPVLLLDDLLVALRSADSARNGGISCSIEPTAQGYRNLNQLLQRRRAAGGPVNPRALEPAMREAFGPQNVVISNVPDTSHFARVLVAADYRMKRLAMNLDPSPVKGLTGYLDLIRGGRASGDGVNPRWWLACDYEPLARSADGLAWELRGKGVKVMTEDSFVTEGGIEGTGRKSPAAEQWAKMMTDHYDELSVKDPVFGQLRNIMDMSIVAALLQRERLIDRAGASLPTLTGASGSLAPEQWNAPKTVQPQCSFLKTGKGWIVTASGGVQIESWQVASQAKTDDRILQRRDKATPAGKSWWWN